MNETWLFITSIYSEQGQELSRRRFRVAKLDVETNTTKITHSYSWSSYSSNQSKFIHFYTIYNFNIVTSFIS